MPVPQAAIRLILTVTSVIVTAAAIHRTISATSLPTIVIRIVTVVFIVIV